MIIPQTNTMNVNGNLYAKIHTITIVENDWIIQAQFLQTTNVNDVQLIARRVIVRAYPVKYGKANATVLKPNLKTIFKRKIPNIRHHVRAIKIISPNRSNDFIPKLDECGTGIDQSPVVPRCPSNPNLLLQDNQIDDIGNIQCAPLTCDYNVQQTATWLSCNRFSSFIKTFAGFSGADMLRMTKNDLIQICGQADGIRLFNSLHSKTITPKLTLYVRRENTSIFNAIYLLSYSYSELMEKLSSIVGMSQEHVRQIYYLGPQGIHVSINEEVIKHFKEEMTFNVELINDNSYYAILLKPIGK